MKTIIFYTVLSLLCLELSAQQQDFKAFRIIKDDYKYFIVPMDFEQKFKAFQQEAEEKNFELGVYTMEEVRQIDSLHTAQAKARGRVRQQISIDSIDPLEHWLHWGQFDLSVKDSLDEEPFPEEWLKAIPAKLTEELKVSAEEKFKHIRLCEYFSIQALVNNQGEVLSVYFQIDPALADLVKEKDLQAIHDAIIKTPFNPANFIFSRWDRAVVKRNMAKLNDWRIELSKEERLALTEEMMKKTKPCIYGIVQCFRMAIDDTLPTQDSL